MNGESWNLNIRIYWWIWVWEPCFLYFGGISKFYQRVANDASAHVTRKPWP